MGNLAAFDIRLKVCCSRSVLQTFFFKVLQEFPSWKLTWRRMRSISCLGLRAKKRRWHNFQEDNICLRCVNLYKVDRCLARYSPGTKANSAIPCITVR